MGKIYKRLFPSNNLSHLYNDKSIIKKNYLIIITTKLCFTVHQTIFTYYLMKL